MLVELRMYMYIYLNIWYMYRYDIHITILIEIRIIIYYVSLSLDNALCLRIWWNMAARGFERDLWQVQAVGRAKDGLDIWEQEVEEAIQAMSEPTQDGVFLELELHNVKSWELDMQESHLFLGHLTDYGYTSISSFGNSKAVPSGAGGGVRFESWLSQLPMNYTILGLVSSPLGGLLLCLFLYTFFGSLMEVVWRLFFYHKPISMICNMYVYASLLLYKKILLCLNPIVRPGCRWCFSIERKLSFFGGNRPLAVISKLACPQALGLFQQWTNTVQFVVEDSTSSTCEKKTKKNKTQERSTLLERARLGMKMGRPQLESQCQATQPLCFFDLFHCWSQAPIQL